MEDKILNLLNNIYEQPKHRFITLTHSKIRIREI